VIRKLHCLGREEGSSLVEFALASMVFLAMLIGCFEATLGLYTYHSLSEAARKATRYAMVRGSTSCTNTPNLSNCNATVAQIQAYVLSLGLPGMSSSNITITPTWCAVTAGPPATWAACSSGTSNAPGNLVNVVAVYQFPLHVPFLPKRTIPLSSTSQMVISQ